MTSINREDIASSIGGTNIETDESERSEDKKSSQQDHEPTSAEESTAGRLYHSSIPHPLPKELSEAIAQLENALQMPVWTLVQTQEYPYLDSLTPIVGMLIRRHKSHLQEERESRS